MRWLRWLVWMLVAGCAGAPKPPPFIAPQTHPALAAGVRLLTEACVQRRVLLGANHFVVEASDAAARKLDAHARAHLARYGVSATQAPALSVCGVQTDAHNPQKTHAQVADGPTASKAPPLAVSDALAAWGDASAGLPALLAELQLAAQRPAAEQATEATLSAAAREVAAAIAAPDAALLYVGLSGNSESAGKIAAQVAAIVGVGVAAGVIAAPAAGASLAAPTAAQTATQSAATQVAANVGASFLTEDGVLVVGALADVRSGRIVWTNTEAAQVDPMKLELLGRGATTERLLITLLNRKTNMWSAPGTPAAKAQQ